VLLDRGASLTLLTFASAPMTADGGGELDGLCAAARQPSLLNTSTCERQRLGQLFLIESHVAVDRTNRAMAEAPYSSVVDWGVYLFVRFHEQDGSSRLLLPTILCAGTRSLEEMIWVTVELDQEK
jgi:hypothetical protein